MRIKFITKVDNSGASFTGFISLEDSSGNRIPLGVFRCSAKQETKDSKARKMVRRLAVKRIIKSLFES